MLNWSIHFKTSILAAVAVTLLTAIPGEAACTYAMFDCTPPGRRSDEAPDLADLASLRSWGKSDAYIAKHCKIMPVHSVPPGCNWRGGAAPAAGGGGTTVLSNSPGYSAPAAPQPSAAAPAARRDAWGKRSPTPAPAQPADHNPAPARDDPPPAKNDLSNLPDDGPYAVELAQAAARYHLPVHLVRAVMMVESGGNPNVQSNKGAIGLMQLLPATAKALGVDDVHDPAQNIMGGARFLRVLANKFEGDLVKVLSGYHAGSMRVASRDATPFAATDDYVRKVLKIYYQLRDAALRGSEI